MPWTADQLLAYTAPAAAPRDRARDFLAEFLQDGPRTSHDVWTAGRDLGLPERTRTHTRRDLKVRSLPVWVEGKKRSSWRLPGQQLPADLPPETVQDDLEPWLAPLREKYPPAPPIDEA